MDELLETNAFNLETPTNTYGVQREVKRFALREHVGKEQQILSNPEKKNLLDDDLMHTNPNISTDPVKEKHLNESRYVKEVVTYFNIDSRNREKWDEKLLPKNPHTRAYTRESENCLIEKFTADQLNLEHQSENPTSILLDPYIERSGDIWCREPLDYDPNDYQIHFPTPLNNVKKVRLVSSEIPNPYQTINPWNNLIILDIHDEDLCRTPEEIELGLSKSISIKSPGLPFFLIQIPIGTYDFLELIEEIQEQVNQVVCHRSQEGFTDLFCIQGNLRTGSVDISINPPPGRNLTFHWRFWYAPEIPSNRLLYWMLGFAQPYERNVDGSNKYVTSWTNIRDFPAQESNIRNVYYNQESKNPCASKKLVHYGFKNLRPYRNINLQPEQYIYMIIENIGTLIDLNQPSTQIFAKIQLPVAPGEVAFNTFVNSPKFYVDAPLDSLETLKIKWVDSDGNLIHWHGLEHSFTIEITQYLDRIAINDFSSTRGVSDPTSFTSKERIFIG